MGSLSNGQKNGLKARGRKKSPFKIYDFKRIKYCFRVHNFNVLLDVSENSFHQSLIKPKYSRAHTFLDKISWTAAKKVSNDIEVEVGSDSNTPANTGVNGSFKPLKCKSDYL